MFKNRRFNLLLLSGHPDGVRVGHLDAWDGIVMLGSHEQLPELCTFPKMNLPGIYLLRNEKDRKPQVYIGKADALSKRIKHHKTEDWWTQVVAISSEKKRLEDGEVRYLEGRIVAQIREAGSVELKNAVNPSIRPLGQGAEENMERFLSGIKDIFSLVHVDAFRSIASSPAIPHEEMPQFEMSVPRGQGTAIAVLNQDKGTFEVQKGSSARDIWADRPSRHENSKRLRQELIEDGTLQVVNNKDKSYRFTKNYPFSSITAAAEVVAGGKRSGPQTWRNIKTGQTFKDWQDAQTRRGYRVNNP